MGDDIAKKYKNPKLICPLCESNLNECKDGYFVS